MSRTSDRAGVIVATLCFVHCTAGPALLTFAGFSSFVRVSERAEVLLLIVSAAIGSSVLLPAYRKRHGRRAYLAMFGAGIAALLTHRHVSGGGLELVTALIGASLIAGAHILNIRYSTRCGCCDSVVRAEIKPSSQSDGDGVNQ